MKLQIEKMTCKEFSLRKKKLLLESQASVSEWIAIPKEKACKKLKEAREATPLAPCSKFNSGDKQMKK